MIQKSCQKVDENIRINTGSKQKKSELGVERKKLNRSNFVQFEEMMKIKNKTEIVYDLKKMMSVRYHVAILK